MLYVIGIGPGNQEYMTAEAEAALAQCDLIVGYPLYLEFVKKQFPEKEYYGTPMTREIERCRHALAEAGARKVALVCSGDAGVYGMAGPVLELAPEYPEVEVRVIPGVTAALGGAAVLGAPLMHDFAVISLSDRLTPMEEICRKLKHAAESDFVIALYNPSSRKRKDYLRMACDILLTCLEPTTVCGYVRNVGRENPECGILSLENLRDFEADMFTTVFIGNSQTKEIGGRMVTPRGYGEKIRPRGNSEADVGIKGEGGNPAAAGAVDEGGNLVFARTGVEEGNRATAGTVSEGGSPVSAGTGEAGENPVAAEATGKGEISATAGTTGEGGILVAAGTTEGRLLCEYFAKRDQTVFAFVATEYGEEMLPESPYIRVETGRKDADEMLAFLCMHKIQTCYDAMHPYAIQAHRNIKEACARGGCSYTRVLREQEAEKNGCGDRISPMSGDGDKAKCDEREPERDEDRDRISPKTGKNEAEKGQKWEREKAGADQMERRMAEKDDSGKTVCQKPEKKMQGNREGDVTAACELEGDEIVRVATIREAAEYLKKQEGNILLTTGSRELKPFAEIENLEERIWVRVLPSVESLEACRNVGIPGRQIIAMHGPFSKEMNELILREHKIRWMVTKDSGKAGGYPEKLEAARAAGSRVVLVERPQEENGISLEKLILRLERR